MHRVIIYLCLRFGTDASKKIVANKTQVTLKQIDTFLDYCWVKYVKAKVEPGARLSVVL